MQNIIYCAHGKESGPWGTKIQALAKLAKKLQCRVESPDYSSTMDPEERVKMLLDLNSQAKKDLILVGSSMGGYVSTVASKHLKVRGLFLLAPAFYIKSYAVQSPQPCAELTVIVHGWNDDVVPVGNSIRFVQQHKSELYLLDSDHRLTDVLPTIEELFTVFLRRLLV